MQGWEISSYSVSVRRPQPLNTNPLDERSGNKNSEDKKGSGSLGQ